MKSNIKKNISNVIGVNLDNNNNMIKVNFLMKLKIYFDLL